MFHRCKTLSDGKTLLAQLDEALIKHGHLRDLAKESYLDFEAFGNPARIKRNEEYVTQKPSETPQVSTKPIQGKIMAGDERLLILAKLLSLAENKKGYDAGFLKSVEASLIKYGSITERQYEALLKTEKWLGK